MGETFNGVEVPDDPEMVSLGLIASAGEARSLAFQALAEAKAGNFEQSDEYMEQSKAAGIRAHDQQTALLVNEANGNHLPVDVLLVHAQDHLMCAMLAQELVAELIELHRNKQDK